MINFTFGLCLQNSSTPTRCGLRHETWKRGNVFWKGQTFINIKHQNERLLKRTPSLSTSNEGPMATRHEKHRRLSTDLFS